MRVIARPLAPGEIDYELVVLAGSVVGFILAACWFALHLPWPICVFHSITGHPCLTCGATRSAIACVHADFLTALAEGKNASPTFREGLATDRVTDAVLESAAKRSWVKVRAEEAK